MVYKVSCVTCNQCYSGSTKRFLHIRIKEHMDNRNSFIFKHGLECNPIWKFDILATTVSSNELRIKEAIIISDMRPSLNTKEDLHNLTL